MINPAPGSLRLTASQGAEIAGDPPPPALDETPTQGFFSTTDLMALLLLTCRHQPNNVLNALNAFAGSPRNLPPLSSEDTEAIAHAVACALVNTDYSDLIEAKKQVEGIAQLYETNTPIPILVHLHRDHAASPNYNMSLEACMHYFRDHSSFTRSQEINTICPTAFRILYGPEDYKVKDPLELARVLDHKYPFTQENPTISTHHRT